MRTFHRWTLAGTVIRGEGAAQNPITQGFRILTTTYQVWRCAKCRAEIETTELGRKPTRRQLRKLGKGETCEEWAMREVMGS